MKIKFLSMLITLIVVSNVNSQSNLNDYKYVIVPNKFDFLKEKDQYQLNSLSEFLFNKYGFLAIKEGSAYPSDLSGNRCLALRSDVIKGPGMFKTKLNVELKDCNDQVVYTSEVGESREKEYKKSYKEALRNAFKSFETVAYTYILNANSTVASNQTSVQDENEVAKEIQKLKEELQTLKKEKKEKVVETLPVIVEQPVVKPPVVKKAKIVETIEEKQSSPGTLYAQKIENGFQLVDSSPKVLYKIKQTSLENVFLVEEKKAVLYKKESSWVLEYYSNNSLKQETLNIKF